MNPDYFLDLMTMFEVDSLLEALNTEYQKSWEQTRMICYFIASSVSTESVEITDIMPFSWDAPKEKIKVTDNDRDRIKQLAQELTIKLNNGK